MKKIIKIGLGLSLFLATLGSLHAGEHTFINVTQASAEKGGKLWVQLSWGTETETFGPSSMRGFFMDPGEEKTLESWNCLREIWVDNLKTHKRGGGKVSFCGNSKTIIGMDSLGMMITTYSVPQP